MSDKQPTTSNATRTPPPAPHKPPTPPQRTAANHIAALEYELQHELSTRDALQQIATLQAEVAHEMAKHAALQQSLRDAEEKCRAMEQKFEWGKTRVQAMEEMLDRNGLP
ncbi:hypothetical protein NpPPO83_00010969 [Neofusicoccum parvum]|uniref:Uncharacterized protein n=1 Tax=Neofusicoccum parvum TaxID=310453 RepID=A0ACB5SFJ1_9PEZI|nr:hypothetical protein NpPPO83_00010969 [Neofusicoccum parvum]